MYNSKDGKEKPVSDDRFVAKQVGGSKDSDISITNIAKKLKRVEIR